MNRTLLTLAGTLGAAYDSIPGDELVIIRNDGSDAVVGKFAQGDLVDDPLVRVGEAVHQHEDRPLELRRLDGREVVPSRREVPRLAVLVVAEESRVANGLLVSGHAALDGLRNDAGQQSEAAQKNE